MKMRRFLMHLPIIFLVFIDMADTNVQNVTKCPRNEDEWTARAKILNCSKTKENEYHCVINDTGTELLEICARSKPILGQSCAEYNIVGQRIHPSDIKCGSDLVSCPHTYQSREAYKYQSCYDKVYHKRRKHNEREPRLKSKEEDHSGMKQVNNQPNYGHVTVSCGNSSDYIIPLFAVLVSVLILIMCCGGFAITIYCMRKRLRCPKGPPRNNQNEEQQELSPV